MEAILTFIQAIIPTLIGPGAAVVVLLLVLLGIGFILYKTIIPALVGSLKQHQKDLQTIMASHDADRSAYMQSIEKITDRLEQMGDALEDLGERTSRVEIMLDLDNKPTRRKLKTE